MCRKATPSGKLPEQILEMNGLESQELKRGQCLVLMKNVMQGGEH